MHGRCSTYTPLCTTVQARVHAQACVCVLGLPHNDCTASEGKGGDEQEERSTQQDPRLGDRAGQCQHARPHGGCNQVRYLQRRQVSCG